MDVMGIVAIPAIVILCYAVGQIVKVTPLDNKFIPAVVLVAGAVLGVAGMLTMPEFPCTDPLTAAAIGIVSGLASTGVNQMVKQLRKE